MASNDLDSENHGMFGGEPPLKIQEGFKKPELKSTLQ